MYSRDYVYVRRYDVDFNNNLMILVSRSDLEMFVNLFILGCIYIIRLNAVSYLVH